jgi:hypothetical protein
MLEGWVDEVLTNSQLPPQHTSKGTLRGAEAAGLARQQLIAAGLGANTVQQLYRSLFVYSMGFADTIKVQWAAWLVEAAVVQQKSRPGCRRPQHMHNSNKAHTHAADACHHACIRHSDSTTAAANAS